MGQKQSSNAASDDAAKAEVASAAAAPSPPAAVAAGSRAGSEERQFTVEEALSVHNALKSGFAEASFQTMLRRVEARHPKRGHRDHADAQVFTTQLQNLLVVVFCKVLPQRPWCLEPGWEGYQQLTSCIASIAEDSRLMQIKEDINRLLGLPRHTVLRPPSDGPVFTHTPDGTGDVPSYEKKMFTDADGDAAHEFWEEDKAGQLRCMSPCQA